VFFASSAGVAGALIGLLFVAISVAPAEPTAAQQVEFDIRAGVAFSALTDALTVSLFALIPGSTSASPRWSWPSAASPRASPHHRLGARR